MASPRARNPAQSPSHNTRFIRQPPPSATRAKPPCAAVSPIHSTSAATSVAWKAEAASRGAHPLVNQSRRKGREVERAAFAAPVGARLDRRRERLQPHRRLALVMLDQANAAQSGDGVEQAAEARRLRSARAARQRLGETRRLGNVGKQPRGLAAAPEPMQHRHAHAPGLARGLVAAGQRQRREMAQATPFGPVERDELAAPGAAVGAIAEAVERRAQRRAFPALLRRQRPRHGRHGAGHARAARRSPRRGASRRNRDAGRRPRSRGLTPRIACRCARVSARSRRASRLSRSPRWGETKASRPRVERDRVLEIAAVGERARAVAAEVDRLGNEAPRPPQIGRRAVENARHAVVGARDDGAGVADDEIGEARKLRARLPVVGDERLAAEIGAGGDERDLARRARARRRNPACPPARGAAANAAAHRAASGRDRRGPAPRWARAAAWPA